MALGGTAHVVQIVVMALITGTVHRASSEEQQAQTKDPGESAQRVLDVEPVRRLGEHRSACHYELTPQGVIPIIFAISYDVARPAACSPTCSRAAPAGHERLPVDHHQLAGDRGQSSS